MPNLDSPDHERPRVVRARGADVDELVRVAVSSKGVWGYDASWLARFRETFGLTPSQVEAGSFYCLRRDGGIGGWYSVRMRDGTAMLDDLWIAPPSVGHGWGRLLFEHACARALALGAQRLEWEADPNAVPFYRHMGGTVTGEVDGGMGRMIPTMALDLTEDLNT